ncbi:MAG: hypothetical protein ACMXYC_01955 [Candidatus Woesearchaeota archaeon]
MIEKFIENFPLVRLNPDVTIGKFLMFPIDDSRGKIIDGKKPIFALRGTLYDGRHYSMLDDDGEGVMVDPLEMDFYGDRYRFQPGMHRNIYEAIFREEKEMEKRLGCKAPLFFPMGGGHYRITDGKMEVYGRSEDYGPCNLTQAAELIKLVYNGEVFVGEDNW